MEKWNVPAVGIMMMAMSVIGCNSSSRGESSAEAASAQPATSALLGNFNADSAYQYVADQVAFGPRVPGTDAHRACRNYIIDKLEAFGADSVITQDATVTAYNGDQLPISNIIAGFNLNKAKRLLLAAHWDSRPWADMEESMDLRNQPVLGANDGGSGVAVLLEIARNLAEKQPSVGVDLIFFDAEDYGNHDGFGTNADTWCLGAQYWADNIVPYRTDNLPVYGILLDMVGGRNARFHYEAFSQQNAETPTIKVWSEAERLGYGDTFIRSIGGAITDDHIVLTRAGIPTTDIVELNNVETSSFPPTWHTLHDDMEHIDRSTLKAVGETVLNVVYKEKPF